MYRYVVLTWDARDDRAHSAAQGVARRLQTSSADWTCALAGAGFMVYHAGLRLGVSDTQILANRQGAVLGTLFTRENGPESVPNRAVLDARESAKVCASLGRHLIERYWGRYVAVAHDVSTNRTNILRDPSGTLPCYFAACDQVLVFCSDPADLLALRPIGYTINWPYIAARVCYPALQLRETGLCEVSELQPGECVEIGGEAPKGILFWEPLRFARTDAIERFDEAVTALRHTARACVQAWARCYRGIIHRLSGGLDSAIVLSCLADAPSKPQLACLNYYSDGPEEDERVFARAAARQARSELIEERRQPDAVQLKDIFAVSKATKPGFYLYAIDHGRFEARLAHARGAGAIFSGFGGDAIFYQGRPLLAAADFAYRLGIRPALARVALDAARVSRVSVWSALSCAVTDGLLSHNWSPLAEMGSFETLVNPDIIEALRRDERFVHPWLADPHGVPPGKLWHALSMGMPPTFYDPLGDPDVPESVSPLISQPLLEVMLRIPTYLLIQGGWDRAAARHAFADDLPRAIIRRRTKGGSTSNVKRIFEANRDFIRELMLDGLLVKERILDRQKLEAALSQRHALQGLAFSEILVEHLCTEAWLRGWHSPGLQAAA